MLHIMKFRPLGAKEISDELRDYAVRNFKAFYDSNDDAAWSDSDDDEDAKEARLRGDDEGAKPRRKQKPKHESYMAAWLNFLALFNGFIWREGSGFGAYHSIVVVKDW
jgi:hypothetical protein